MTELYVGDALAFTRPIFPDLAWPGWGPPLGLYLVHRTLPLPAAHPSYGDRHLGTSLDGCPSLTSCDFHVGYYYTTYITCGKRVSGTNTPAGERL